MEEIDKSMDWIYEDKIRKKFDIRLNGYDYFLVDKGYYRNYFYVSYIYKGSIRKLKPKPIVIYLSTKTYKIKLEMRDYLAEGIYLKYNMKEEDIYKYLDEMMEAHKEEIVV